MEKSGKARVFNISAVIAGQESVQEAINRQQRWDHHSCADGRRHAKVQDDYGQL